MRRSALLVGLATVPCAVALCSDAIVPGVVIIAMSPLPSFQ
jgi:hypothetical protein